LTAKTTGKIALEGSLSEKRVLAQEVFGSNLILDSKKARGSSVNLWFHLTEKSPCGGMVPLYNTARTFFQGQTVASTAGGNGS
jgi:hypothetical protein